MLLGGLLCALYRELSEWLVDQGAKGQVQVADPDATAAVLITSLTYYRVLQELIGHAPGDVEVAAYLRAWVDSATATIAHDIRRSVGC